jgi:hypothetical protein
VDKWIEKNWTGKGWKRVQFEVQDYFPACLKRAWKEIKARAHKPSPMPVLKVAENFTDNPRILTKVRKTRMDDKARLIVLAFNETGQIPKEAIKKPKKTQVADNQGDMFKKENNQNNQLSMF